LTRQVDWFTPGQLQAQILNKRNSPNAVRPGLLAGPKALDSVMGMAQAVGSWLTKGPKMLPVGS
jgi:hypothetical protein